MDGEEGYEYKMNCSVWHSKVTEPCLVAYDPLEHGHAGFASSGRVEGGGQQNWKIFFQERQSHEFIQAECDLRFARIRVVWLNRSCLRHTSTHTRHSKLLAVVKKCNSYAEITILHYHKWATTIRPWFYYDFVYPPFGCFSLFSSRDLLILLDD